MTNIPTELLQVAKRMVAAAYSAYGLSWETIYLDVFAHGGDIATLRLRHPSQLVAATQHAGAALAGHVELPLLQMFAYTAASGELPTQEQCATCVAVAKLAARLVPMNAQAGAMSSADLRRVVAEALLPGRDTITLPQHPWSFAQALCGYGKA